MQSTHGQCASSRPSPSRNSSKSMKLHTASGVSTFRLLASPALQPCFSSSRWSYVQSSSSNQSPTGWSRQQRPTQRRHPQTRRIQSCTSVHASTPSMSSAPPGRVQRKPGTFSTCYRGGGRSRRASCARLGLEIETLYLRSGSGRQMRTLIV